MKVKELLTEGLDKKSTYKILLEFIRFAAEDLELDKLPKFNFMFDTKRSLEHKSFGGYAPGEKHIDITVVNRHIMDVCRTLAHELVHFSQDLKNELEDPDAGATGSPQENEANARAAVIMRNWGKKHPQLFDKQSISESNELLDKPTPSAAEIIAKHGMSEQEFVDQLRIGVKDELEHTSNVKMAIEIAMDHLNERPDYYTRLQQAMR
jgi:hypothetical protein